MTSPSARTVPTLGELFDGDREVAIGWAAVACASRADDGAHRAGLSLAQLRLLSAIAWRSSNPSVIADVLDVKPPTVTRMADRLVALGLVDRTVDAGDRRRMNHTLTDRGREALLEATRAISASIRAVLAILPPEDSAAAEAGLLQMHRAASSHMWREDPRPGWPVVKQG